MQNFLRLCGRQSALLNKHFVHLRTTNAAESQQTTEDPNNKKDLQCLLDRYKDKITFNSYLEHEKLELGYHKYRLKTIKNFRKEHAKSAQNECLQPLPISLQYCVDKDRLLKEETESGEPEPEKTFHLPFSNITPIHKKQKQNESEINHTQNINETHNVSNTNRWMTNYEHFDDSTLESYDNDSETIENWNSRYGTPDPTARVSRVPCGGCGALLHCNNPAIPGYLPSEIFKNRTDTELKTMECQRCHFLKEYNIALDVSVQPEEYEKLLHSIRHVKSLVLLMVDLLDFPCSIWPGIVDVIGTQRPVILVANKVDLLPGDSIGYLKRVKQSLLTEINKTKLAEANIKYVALISAKTGYGVEDLITAMFKTWMCKGDVFLVGCTNVGKSSLFNALLQSDYCKVHAVDLVQRATVSRWPGTTLNLLKFPINRPSGWKIYARSRRLRSEAKLLQVEKLIGRAHRADHAPVDAPALIGHIGRTFSEHVDDNRTFGDKKMLVLNERDEVFAQSKWFYDTPGVIHPDQVLSLLSTEELLATIPERPIRPQTYYLKRGTTLFIGGLARVDLVESTEPCRFTVFCAESLPITVTNTDDADEVYDKFLGTEMLAVPAGGAQRLRHWPGLQRGGELYTFTGEGPKVCCGDVVLSSVGWVSVTVKGGSECRVAAWTPAGRGVHARHPALLPYAVNLKGKRVRDTPAYMIGKVFAGDEQ